MTPAPQPKTKEITGELWPLFLEGEPIGRFKNNRFQQEVKSIKLVDPDGFIFLSGLLAAINDNIDEVLSISRTALQFHKDDIYLQNWSNLLMQLGLVQQSYIFMKEAWRLNPSSTEILNRLVVSASAADDLPTLEQTLEAWHKLNPGKVHPLVVSQRLNKWANNPEEEANEEQIAEALDFFNDTGVDDRHVESKRMKKLLNTLMEKIQL